MTSEANHSFGRVRQACVDFWLQSFDFTGRTGRYDYWIVVLMIFVVEFVVDLDNMPNQIQNIYVCALMIPFLSMTVRRLRDAGYQFVWLWSALIPFYFLFQFWVLLFWLFRPTHETFLVEDAWRARALKRISGGRS